jgi:hypothetical protein
MKLQIVRLSTILELYSFGGGMLLSWKKQQLFLSETIRLLIVGLQYTSEHFSTLL